MAKPGAVPRSVILAVLLVQFFPQVPRSVSAGRYIPAVVSREGSSATGWSRGASFEPKDIDIAGLKLERRLYDRDETQGAAFEASVDEVSQRLPVHYSIYRVMCVEVQLLQNKSCRGLKRFSLIYTKASSLMGSVKS